MDVTSTPGQGTMMTVLFPIEPPAELAMQDQVSEAAA